MNFEKYSINEGLPHPEVYKITQSPDKILWLATEGGVAAFDGKTSINYTENNGLPDNDVTNIFSDSQGRVWVSTRNGGIVYIQNGEIHPCKELNERNDYKGFVDMGETPDGTLYFFYSAHLVQYKATTADSISTILRFASFDLQACHAGLVYNNDTLYAAFYQDDKTLFTEISIHNQSIRTINIDSIPHFYTYELSRDSIGNVWLGAQNGVHKYDQKDFRFEYPIIRVHGLFNVGDKIWYSSEGGGFGLIDTKTRNIQSYEKSSGLASPFIYDIFRDDEQNVWLASYGHGLIKFGDPSLKYYRKKNGLPSNTIFKTIEFQDKIIVGSNKGLVIIKDDIIIDTLLIGNQAKTLSALNDSVLFVGTPIGIYTSHNLKKTNLYSVEDQLRIFCFDEHMFRTAGSRILYSEYDKNQTLMLGDVHEILPFWNGYIFRDLYNVHYVYEKDDSMHVQLLMNHYEFNDYRSMDSLSLQELYIKSAKHLHRLFVDADSLRLEHIALPTTEAFSQINSIAIHDSTIWFGGALQIFSSPISGVTENLPETLTKYSLSSNEMNALLLDDGMLIQDDGSICLSTLNGLWIFDPTKYRESSLPPLISFKSIKSNDQAIEIHQNNTIPRFKHHQNHLHVEMQAISYSNPLNTKYKYRLIKNHESRDWSEETDDSQVNYSYLPPGEYLFEFTADNGYDVWASEPQQFSFIIKNQFWKNMEFWFILLGIVFFAVFYGRYRIKKLAWNRQRKMTEAIINATETNKQNLAREIHDSVGQKLLLLVRQARKLDHQDLEQLSLSSLEEIRSISRGLHPVNLSKFGLQQALKELIEEIDEHSDIFFYHSIDNINTSLAPKNHLHLFRIIQEALSNILKHSKATEASIIVEQKQDHIQISIDDNGIGFQKDNPSQVIEHSLGLQTIQERCNYIAAQLQIITTPKNGTSIQIQIPIQDE